MVEAGRFRRISGAVLGALLLATAGGSAAAPASGAQLDDLLPHLHTSLTAEPAPLPVPSEGRIPVSLRLAEAIWTDGPPPPALAEARFEFDRNFRLDLSQVERCPAGPRFDIRTGVSPCEKYRFASGWIKVNVAFPENTPITVKGRAIAFESAPREFMIHAFLPAPVTALIAIPVEIGRARDGIYGLRATAAIPKIAGGYGSLVYLGLRFRKGLFSVACPQGHLQSRLINTYADGTKLSGASVTTC